MALKLKSPEAHGPVYSLLITAADSVILFLVLSCERFLSVTCVSQKHLHKLLFHLTPNRFIISHANIIDRRVESDAFSYVKT